LERGEEIDLARQLLEGKPEAFDRFVDHFRAKIFSYSQIMCGHREDAEEVVQETLLKVFENFGQLREPEHVRAWVFRIAKNACLIKRRKSIYAPQQELSLDELMPARGNSGGPMKIEIADWSGIPEDEVLRSELQRVLGEAIAEMPEIYRSVMLLRDVEELSTEEAAQILDLNTDAVKTRLHRARLLARKKLDSYLRASSQPVEKN
jgi:RNA polymerase sigma-70 factor (ECF subfamily)